MAVVIKDCAYVLVNVPDFVRYGSKPIRDLEENPNLLPEITGRLRSFEEVLAYGPNQVFIGNLHPDELNNIPQPWYKHPLKGTWRQGPFGEIMPEEEFYGWLKIADDFDLVWLDKAFIDRIRDRVAGHPFIGSEEIKKLGIGVTPEQNRKNLEENFALPLYFHGEVVGSLKRAHDKDDSLKASVLMENLLAKASGALVMRHLMKRAVIKPEEVDFILECSETAIGDRYNRGGGSLAKAIGEMCRCQNATGHDIRAFCAAPIHAIIDAAGLVEAGIYRNVVVVGGGCQAKIGMKYAAHLKNQMPILEDVLAGIAFLITKDDGVSPRIRLDCVGKHDIGAGSSQQSIMTSLIVKPLAKIGLKMMDVDKYATEMHNPEVTLPAGSGNTPYTNYKIMAALAVLNKEIDKTEIEKFVKERGMPGFSPTQGHVPAAVPFFGHALMAMQKGEMKRTMFVAKGSLFLGRMSQLSDGMSFLLEANKKDSA
ncbi:MAG: glycine/sarcosine/betaine reductase complex component C subunit beta [Deltaproteobacteria bacterium]|nr:glycine/sarcosine/betaine reductase complex component C subunit beta [Deltaproteobacteria bacterium]